VQSKEGEGSLPCSSISWNWERGRKDGERDRQREGGSGARPAEGRRGAPTIFHLCYMPHHIILARLGSPILVYPFLASRQPQMKGTTGGERGFGSGL
jgi:hypothetical protein